MRQRLSAYCGSVLVAIKSGGLVVALAVLLLVPESFHGVPTAHRLSIPRGAISISIGYLEIPYPPTSAPPPQIGPVRSSNKALIRRIIRTLNSFRPLKYQECMLPPQDYTLRFSYRHRPRAKVWIACGAAVRFDKHAKGLDQVTVRSAYVLHLLARILLQRTHSKQLCRQPWHGHVFHPC